MLAAPSASSDGAETIEEQKLILATTRFEDYDRFMEVFGHKGRPQGAELGGQLDA